MRASNARNGAWEAWVKKLTFGYLYDFRQGPNPAKSWAAHYADVLDAVAWSEQAGFDGAWVPEHHCAPDGYMPSPLVALGAIAARTKRLRIGTGVALAPLYNPVRFASDCAVLDALSGGRLELGLAIGYRKREYAAMQAEFGKRGKVFDELLEIVTRLWAGECVSFAGQHFTLDNVSIAPTPAAGRIPMYIGGFAPKALDRVARYADGYFGNADCVPMYLERMAAHGRDPAQASVRVPGLFVTVAKDPEAAMDELAPYYHYINTVYAGWNAEDQALGIDNPALGDMDLDAFRASGIFQVWTPEQAVAKFRAMREKFPLDHFMMSLPPGLPLDRFVAYAQVFADEVMPAFA